MSSALRLFPNLPPADADPNPAALRRYPEPRP
jgi:hypothetical protein